MPDLMIKLCQPIYQSYLFNPNGFKSFLSKASPSLLLIKRMKAMTAIAWENVVIITNYINFSFNEI